MPDNRERSGPSGQSIPGRSGAHGWTPERRAQAAEAIHRWKPWERSTGPKTAEGKQKVSRNAYRGSPSLQRKEAFKMLQRLLREQRARLREVLE